MGDRHSSTKHAQKVQRVTMELLSVQEKPTTEIHLVSAVVENGEEERCCRGMGDWRKNLFVIGRKLRKVGSVSTNTTAEHWQEDNIWHHSEAYHWVCSKNGYIDESMQKAGISQIKSCINRAYSIWEEIRNVKEMESVISVIWQTRIVQCHILWSRGDEIILVFKRTKKDDNKLYQILNVIHYW